MRKLNLDEDQMQEDGDTLAEAAGDTEAAELVDPASGRGQARGRGRRPGRRGRRGGPAEPHVTEAVPPVQEDDEMGAAEEPAALQEDADLDSSVVGGLDDSELFGEPAQDEVAPQIRFKRRRQVPL